MTAGSWRAPVGLLLLFWLWPLVPPAHAATARPGSDRRSDQTDADPRPAAADRLQGRWDAYSYGSSFKTWTISFDKQRFRADGEAGDWYAGRIEVRDQIEPSELDFVIEDCSCKYKGMTSQGIFRWEGESLIMASPAPGDPRPGEFDESSGEMMELRRSVEAESTSP